jgi:hypothetical protein
VGDLIRDIDRLLRGGFTQKDDLQSGRIQVPVATLVKAGLLLGVAYGVFMGLYAGIRSDNPDWWKQLAATTVKVPLLFLLTLVVTFPSLYVFSALANTRLRHLDTLRLLLAAISVNLALLASLGPVTGFFTLSTDSYPFMVLLNVVFFAVAGFVGLGFLRRALRSVFDAGPMPPPPPLAAPSSAGEDEGADAPQLERLIVAGEVVPPPRAVAQRAQPDPAKRIFGIWTFIYAVVGAQMGWILRPFIGSPDMQFQFFRARESNFFRAVISTIGRLFTE